MTQYIGCDMHKRYSVFVKMDEAGNAQPAIRVDHDRDLLRTFLHSLPPESSVAIETMGSWYWLVDEVEAAGQVALLTDARKAKLMMGQINKTDKLDARGLAVLLRNGTLPTVWIPPQSLRDLRELPRFRMKLTRIRTRLKNYIHATLDKYAIHFTGISDLFGVKGRNWLRSQLEELPAETGRCLQQSLQLLDQAQAQIIQTEKRIRDQIEQTPSMQLLQSLPGVGPILSILIALEVGSIERFPCAEKLASYAGTVPRVHSSGGKTHYGPVRHDVNHYLKWAFVEAANAIVMHQKRRPTSHVVHLYRRIRQRRGHGKAIVAIARHLAEATYWMLKKEEVYKEPSRPEVSSTPGQTR